MRYHYLLVDNDGTLMDFDAAEYAALKEAMHQFHLPEDDATAAAYAEMNHAQWLALEQGKTDRETLRVARFQQLLAYLHRDTGMAEALSQCYEECLGTHAELLPGAMELMQAVTGKMKIALVSNGISAIQRNRLARCPYTPLLDAVIISEEVGHTKPDPGMVYAALEALHCTDPSQAVLLGDSLSADIAAARNAGIDSIWLAQNGAESPLPTYTVRNLKEAQALLLA